MADKPTKNLQKFNIKTSNPDRIIPKLSTKVLLSQAGDNSILTFVLDIGKDEAQIIESIVIDKDLHKKLIKLLQDDLEKERK